MMTKSARWVASAIAITATILLAVKYGASGSSKGDAPGTTAKPTDRSSTSPQSPKTTKAGQSGKPKGPADDAEISRNFRLSYQAVLGSEEALATKNLKLEALAKEYVQKVGINAAVQDLESFLGPGSNKNLLLSYFFKNAKEPQSELVDLTRSFELGVAREWAFKGVVANMLKKGIDPDGMEKLLPPHGEESSQFTALLAGLLKWEGDPGRRIYSLDDSLDLLKRAFPNESNYAYHLSELLSNLQGYQPFEVWSRCSDVLLANPDTKAVAVNQMISAMMEASPERALAVVLDYNANNPGVIPLDRFSDLISNYLKRDANEALKWYDANAATLPKEIRERIAVAFVESSIDAGAMEETTRWLSQIEDPALQKKVQPKVAASLILGDDFTQAWKYVNAIQDPALKKHVEGKIWAREQTAVRDSANADPVGTLNSLVSGTSTHATYWIEEATTTWLAKDFDGAQNWFSQHWESMPNDKAQYGAAALSKKAAEMGDLDTARQWATYVNDPKAQKRVETAIMNAGQKGTPR